MTIVPTMSPRQRKFLDPRSKRFEIRFAIRLRAMLDERRLTVDMFLERLQAAGVDVTAEAVRKWLSGGRVPRPQDMEAIGRVLKLPDYRDLLPPAK